MHRSLSTIDLSNTPPRLPQLIDIDDSSSAAVNLLTLT
jgi:hypothetical protein